MLNFPPKCTATFHNAWRDWSFFRVIDPTGRNWVAYGPNLPFESLGLFEALGGLQQLTGLL